MFCPTLEVTSCEPIPLCTTKWSISASGTLTGRLERAVRGHAWTLSAPILLRTCWPPRDHTLPGATACSFCSALSTTTTRYIVPFFFSRLCSQRSVVSHLWRKSLVTGFKPERGGPSDHPLATEERAERAATDRRLRVTGRARRALQEQAVLSRTHPRRRRVLSTTSRFTRRLLRVLNEIGFAVSGR